MIVVPCSKKICDLFVSEKHYSRTPPIFWEGFGLIEDGHVTGVVVYGQPSPPVQKHAFRDRDFRLYELSRLVVQNPTKNAASFLVGNSLKMLPSPCAVVSYADMGQGHCGIVYQATNWVYTGATTSHDNLYLVAGKKTHPMTLRDRGITDPIRWAKEEGVEVVQPHEKHRYFQFVGDRRQKRAMSSKLNYSVVPSYPKAPSVRYDDGPKLVVPYVDMTPSISLLDMFSGDT